MRTRVKKETVDELVQMTPMIDVVFLLLIFFIVVFSPAEVIGRFDAQGNTCGSTGTGVVGICIDIQPSGTFVAGQRVERSELDLKLARLASRSTAERILLACHPRSAHKQLVDVMDMCAKSGLTDISIISP